jgi:hypothetical protein
MLEVHAFAIRGHLPVTSYCQSREDAKVSISFFTIEGLVTNK